VCCEKKRKKSGRVLCRCSFSRAARLGVPAYRGPEAKGLPTLSEDRIDRGGSHRRHPGQVSVLILFGTPHPVQRFFAPLTPALSQPVRQALPAMALALLLAPHRRCLKTRAGVVLGRRAHASTLSRRLRNPPRRTWDWYACLHQHTLADLDR
jgi:hypothetical protein